MRIWASFHFVSRCYPVKRDTIDGTRNPFRGTKIGSEVLDAEQCVAHNTTLARRFVKVKGNLCLLQSLQKHSQGLKPSIIWIIGAKIDYKSCLIQEGVCLWVCSQVHLQAKTPKKRGISPRFSFYKWAELEKITVDLFLDLKYRYGTKLKQGTYRRNYVIGERRYDYGTTTFFDSRTGR